MIGDVEEGPPMAPATVRDRAVARLIDTGVLAGAVLVLGLAVLLLGDGSRLPAMLAVPAFGVLCGYEFVMLGAYGETIGKRVMRLRVVRLDGDEPGWGAAFSRTFFLTIAGCLSCGLGGLLFYLSPLLDPGPWKRGWHDHVAATFVVSTRDSDVVARGTVDEPRWRGLAHRALGR
ncbi:RDD family protein [Dactylosporangium sp. CA-152071]|uniref:RDD family protein n=1 Tax=Dactylosporangium sp. CA-152071 TaxID=3239933 RepID=UPI003D8A26F8